ncbi:CHAT domain-containing protein [Streptomyces griseoaurantiacus]|uniref:CHAT domain-containing protein n=1 Tax=Streptomyces griseoaurantiacus TaxID=68213 RepID=A0A7W2DRH5_9ACTN|nr:CHAT domain-containing protein [Streptomyces griseoaurantiacus]MBA5221654.1 CHAT domain-containing protein [Streptomyces griseoaurantiacus]
MQSREQGSVREDELEGRVAAVRSRLNRLAAKQDLGVVLEPEALAEARRLAAILRSDVSDLEGHYLLGWLHAVRYRALPDRTGQRDKEEAVAQFALCFVFGDADAEDLPDELLPEVAQHALGFVWKTQQAMSASPSPGLFARVSDLLRRIAAAIPRGESEHAEMLSDLAVMLKSHFDAGGEPADLDAAIDAARGAVESTATGHPKRSILLSNLSGVLLARFAYNSAAADLDEAIETGRLSLQEELGSPADRAGGLNGLGTALKTRFTEKGILSDLDAAIAAFQEASELCVEEYDKAGVLHNLGIAWEDRYDSTGVLADLENAIDSCRAAVEAAPEDHPGRSIFLSGLGGTSLTRFERTGETAYLDRSIDVLREALEILPPGHRTRGLRLSGLGKALLARYRLGGDRSDLDAAIETNRAAARETGSQQTEFNAILNNLGVSLWQRFERTGHRADLDEAISAGRASAQATADGHVDRPSRLSNVGMMLWTRFKLTGALSDLDAAIEFAHDAVEAVPPGYSALAGMLSNLGAVMVQRYERNGDPEDLDEAIRKSREAVDITDAGSPDRPRYLANLCAVLHARYQRAGGSEDLDGAVQAGRDAADVPSHHPERPRYLAALGGVLTIRFEETGSAVDLDDAVAACQTAVDITPVEDPERVTYLFQLGSALRSRYERTGSRRDFDRALAANMEGSRVKGASPSTRIRAARAAASLTGRTDPDLAADFLSGAVRLLPEVADRRLRRGDRQHAMGEWSGLAGEAAALALAARGDTPADQAVRALQLLESGRGVLHSQVLDLRSDLAELRECHPDLARHFEVLRDEIDRPTDATTSPAELLGQVSAAVRAVDAEERRRGLVGQLQATLDRIRAQDGFASFARPPAVGELLAQAAFGPVVSFNVSHYRSDALLLTSGGIKSLSLPDLTYHLVVDRIQTFHQALETVANPRTTPLARKTAQATLHTVLEWLWDAAAEPVLSSLGFTGEPSPGQPWPRVWWAPGGLLSLLPLHAAGHHSDLSQVGLGGRGRRTVMDRVVSSYTTTIRALHHARHHRTSAPSVSRSLIVAMPTTPGVPGRLDHVSKEATLLCNLLPKPTLLIEPDAVADGMTAPELETRPTKARVLETLSDCGIVHFACHGAHDPDDPSRSLLLLHDHERDPLTVASLAEMRMDSAQLAYLSACRTAFMDSVELIDEAIHLTSAFQLAGFPHVIGTLWEINDEVASHMAASFYAELDRVTNQPGGLDTDAAARALHYTVRKVRDRYPKSPYLWAAHLHAGI